MTDSTVNTCQRCGGTGEYRTQRGTVLGRCFACDGKGSKNVDSLPASSPFKLDIGPLSESFRTAVDNGYGKPVLRLGDYTFSLAPMSGRNAGFIYVKKDGEYFGKINPQGSFFHTLACKTIDVDSIAEVIRNPEESATIYGRRTGKCSCCGRTLTNHESIERGIGPICAENYGWGG